ncbi:glycoside hydrolase family 2 protein [Fibrella sp. HMF5335]|uniref:Glycoside hydrolase family 2 protein n=1 Tax=Fibrella rubiginis TaxID=2817060 RepID=A0A939GKX5_9BACT|nr:glycosyl hydrolase [Fibrella rubiginis]MBO0938312.1 glycoside hydrolase family 2 protein [Fibrella rubiginis]
MIPCRYWLVVALGLLPFVATAQPTWPTLTQQAKPWTRWWWMGSAVNNADLTRLLTDYQKAGLGGVEITPIYGVKGAENQFINFLSPTWTDRLTHTLTEAKRLNMGIDLAQASGWPFGGPWVSPADASKYVAYKTYAVAGGKALSERVVYNQKPLVRAVGEPINIDKLTEPIARNPDLQRHAFDQVRFPKPLPLQTLMAYSGSGEVLDLTRYVDASGKLTWTAPTLPQNGQWTLYALFQGWHGKQVERAGPGGEGDVIDHFSRTATQQYLARFDGAFRGRNVGGIRAFFNDSYEVDDAQGEANWTPALFAEFNKRRGYDLRLYLPALFGNTASITDTAATPSRILCDYRETIGDLLLDNYTRTWAQWAHSRGQRIRNQAHGSPANILDLYAATDIPETEGTELLRIKLASSAANVTGKPLISAESATWHDEHFLSTLGGIKTAMDRYLLGGVNHTFYHGTNYSPQAAAWPGWLFYAAVHFNPNNPFWTDFSQLNHYVARCQSMLQRGRPHNDVLVYLPMYDAYSQPAKGGLPPALLQHFDGIEHGFKNLPVAQISEELLAKGYAFDFLSDRQLRDVTTQVGKLKTGGNTYQAILVPNAHLMPLPTLQHLLNLAQQGATVVFAQQLPADVPGFADLSSRRLAFKKLLARLSFTASGTVALRVATVGKGHVLVGENVSEILTQAGVARETMADQGLVCVRRTMGAKTIYFVANQGTDTLHTSGWVRLATRAKSVAMYNPMTGQTGMARIRPTASSTDVYMPLLPGEAILLETSPTRVAGPAYPYDKPAGPPQPLSGPWTLQFVSGGPTLPAPVQLPDLRLWTDLRDSTMNAFSGSATYTIQFARPAGSAPRYRLDLGKVFASARVQLNGQDMGTLIGPNYRITLPGRAIKAQNTLVITVSNSMANRIIDLDKRGVNWRLFYNTNFPARFKENRDANGLFTTKNWLPQPSGLAGPVTLTPVD